MNPQALSPTHTSSAGAPSDARSAARIRRRPLLRAALAGLLLPAAVTGCTSSTPASSPTATATSSASALPTGGATRRPDAARTPHGGLPDARRIDHGDATAVSRAALTVAWTIDTVIDQGQRDAFARAAPYLTPAYAAQLAQQPLQAAPSTWWDHRAYSKLQLEPIDPDAGAPQDTTTSAYRQWRITNTPTGRDGWQGTPVKAIVFVTLTRANTGLPWRIAEITAS
jgi:hypothetical protein